MIKHNLPKIAAIITAIAFIFLLAACDDRESSSSEQTASRTTAESESDFSEPASSESVSESEASVPSPDPQSSKIVKINGGADEVGIYSVVVRLTDQAADKGVIEMVYYGSKGSPQENSIVNTFRIEYYKEPAGTFEISTFYDGEVYQNLHHKDEMKVTNTFGAALRAGSVIISYTPEGGENEEVFRADADYFR